ncbi:MAG: putative lipid II flippase FtsW [Pseudomonadota bacterium]
MTQAIPIDNVEERFKIGAPKHDVWLIGVVVFLLVFGLIMVASASMPIATRYNQIELYYFWRQCAAVALGILSAMVILRIPLIFWQKTSSLFLFLAIAMLAAVLVPGLGREVNGSLRWIDLGAITLQASEPAKFAVIIYVGAYLVRHLDHVRSEFLGFIKPIGVMTAISGLLLLEPDFGAAAVMFATVLGMLFLAGVALIRFVAWGVIALGFLATLVLLAPYRMQRLMAFRDPWADPFDSGFQLTQALIAFGRGEWFGVGLGNSVQKLFYLPEVHTDFLFAVIGEEFGLLGSLTVIAAFLFLVWRIFFIASLAESKGQIFAAYSAYGVGLLIGFEAFINIGVNIGLLPTKGLTLPMMSYGSNSLVVILAMIGFVLRVELEARDPDQVEGR